MDYDGGFVMLKEVDWTLLRPHHTDYFIRSQNNYPCLPYTCVYIGVV